MASNKKWRKQQSKDIYFKKAIADGWRSRAVYKLDQINKRSHLLKKGMICLDLGASPGGWSQFISRKLDGDVKIIAVDILPIDKIESVDFYQGDFTDEVFYDFLLKKTKNIKIDLVMSDMAPNISGIKVSDQAKSIYLAELARDACKEILKSNGNFICKLFQGEGFDKYIKETRGYFKKVSVFKPNASRADSSEIFMIAKGFIG
jgi:23S rRNA (uridine2552-2'-O)-methyltransferase